MNALETAAPIADLVTDLIDATWHLDGSPSVRFHTGGKGWHLWIDEEDPAAREHGGARFILCPVVEWEGTDHWPLDKAPFDDTSEEEPFECETIAELVTHLRTLGA